MTETDLETAWYAKRGTPERWNIIREAYRLNIDSIMEARARGLRGRTSPYLLDWDFTPIEEMAWQDIRSMCLPLYPQFPVDRYFVDFGDPHLKIAIELDGKDFHDAAADRVRDTRLWELGWRTFRIPGRKSFAWKGIHPFGDEWVQIKNQCRSDAYRLVHDWAMGCSEGFFWSLARIVYDHSLRTSEHEDREYREIAEASLYLHRGIAFSLPWCDQAEGDE